MKRILLLGPNGQLGTDIRHAAAANYHDLHIQGLGRDELDVTDVESIGEVLRTQEFDILINCTSYHKTDEVESNADQAVTVNAHAVKGLAEACKTKKARFIHISTDYVFDGQNDRPYIELDSIGPLNVYGATKALGESLARAVWQDTVIFRVASLFGVAGASGKGGNFVETMIRVGAERGQLKVISDQRMSPTSTADLAEMILKSIEVDIPAGTYHAVNSGDASWYEFAKSIIELSGVEATVSPIPATEYPLPAQRPAYSVMDNTKLTAFIGDIPNWHDALERYLAAKGHLVA